MIPNLFPTYPTDIAQHVIDAMTPGIEAEIKRVHEAVEAAKANALKEALNKFNREVTNDPPPSFDPEPPVSALSPCGSPRGRRSTGVRCKIAPLGQVSS